MLTELKPTQRPPDPRPAVDRVDMQRTMASVRAGLFGLQSEATTIDRFVILATAGAGSMGRVYVAYDPMLDRRVAVKVIVTHGQTGDVEGRRRALIQEARALAKVSHPNVVPVHEVGTVEDEVYVAMEYVDGSTLREWLKQSRPWREIVRMFIQAGRGLVAAHEQGIVHRDFKPSNVLIGGDGRARVVDFGLARAGLDAESSSSSVTLEASDSATLTQRHIGTPAFMAPEQFRSGEVDARSDQFSFCAALFEALFGVRAFAWPDYSTLGDLGSRTASNPRRVPTSVERAIVRGLNEDPSARFAALAELLSVLERRASARRAPWIAGFAGLALAGLAVAWGQQARGPGPCTDSADQMAATWNDEQRGRIRQAFEATGVAYAEASFTAVDRELDRYSAGWVAMHTEACEATHVRGVQSGELLDLRMDCLAQRRRAITSAIDVLAEADTGTVEKGALVIARLPAIDRCADAAALRAVMPPPDDPEVVTVVESMRDRIQRANSLIIAGRVQLGLSQATELAEEATKIAYGPVRAEAYQLLGKAHINTGSIDAGIQAFREAYWASLAAGHDRVLAYASSILTRIFADIRPNETAMAEWARHAEASAARFEPGTRQEADYLAAYASVLGFRDHLEPALDAMQRSLAIFETIEGPASIVVAMRLTDVGVNLYQAGRLEAARDHFQRALQLARKIFGPEHPFIASVQTRLAHTTRKLGDAEGGYQMAKSALEMYRRLRGDDARRTGAAWGAVGTAAMTLARYDEALRAFEQQMRIAVLHHGNEHSQVYSALNNTGIVLRRLARYSEAEHRYQRALEIATKLYGEDHREVGVMLSNLGNIAGDRGQPEKALAYYERALGITEATFGVYSARLAETLTGLASEKLAAGRRREAAMLYLRAVRICERVHRDDHPGTAMALMGWVDTQDESAATIDALRRALRIRENVDPRRNRLGATRFALARALWRQGHDRVEAHALAVQAREDFTSVADRYESQLADVKAWLRTHPRPG